MLRFQIHIEKFCFEYYCEKSKNASFRLPFNTSISWNKRKPSGMHETLDHPAVGVGVRVRGLTMSYESIRLGSNKVYKLNRWNIIEKYKTTQNNLQTHARTVMFSVVIFFFFFFLHSCTYKEALLFWVYNIMTPLNL